MMKKIIAALFVSAIIAIGLVTFIPHYSEAQEKVGNYIVGRVYDSADGVAEIKNDTTDSWIGSTITVYSLNRLVPPAIDNGSEDAGRADTYWDEFQFDAGWGDLNNAYGICVGELEKDDTVYTFITNFNYSWSALNGVYVGRCAETEWERIPEPIIYLNGDAWVNLSIPKFTNPQRALYNDLTTNAENTLGFAVYRDGAYIGSTTIGNATNYFFNDTVLAEKTYTVQNYSVAPVARGDYLVSSPAPSVSIESPKGSVCWTGDSNKIISYALVGGAFPCTVNISYSTDGGSSFTWIDTTSKDIGGEHTYTWHLPVFQGDENRVRVRINVTDALGRVCSAMSAQDFTIDCTKPSIVSVSPLNQAEDISVYEDLDINFTEPMNKASVESAFSITPSVSNLSWNWISDNRAIVSHPEFVVNTDYICAIAETAKDLSDPGNYLTAYSWNFTTTDEISLSLHFPYTGAVLTGAVNQEIRYGVGGGIAPYKVKIDFSNDGGSSWAEIANLSNVPAGINTYSWPLSLINTSYAKLRITAAETAIQARTRLITSEYFSIDSTKPEIADWSGITGWIRTTEPVRVCFSERMNKTSAEHSFSLSASATGTIVNCTATCENNDKTVIFTPTQALTSNTNYTATISSGAKDVSIPGNAITVKTWTFTAIEGLGVISTSVSFIPIEPQKGDKITISVTVSNTGPQAFGYSATIIVNLYQLKEATLTLVKTESIPNMLANGTPVTKTFEVTPDDIGTYEYQVKVYSMSSQDIVDGESGKTAISVLSISVAEKKGVGIGPYALIALMVLLVIVIGFLVVASYKKEFEKKEKPAEEEEEEKKSE